MRSALALALLLSACGGAPWASTPGMGWRWPHEPTVGPSTLALAPAVDQALTAWGYGRAVPSCVGADVCVLAGRRSHAGPSGGRCLAEVQFDAFEIVAHEIGHCFGLPHSSDPESVMFWYSRPGQTVTAADRSALR